MSLTYSEVYSRCKAVLESWFRKLEDIPLEPRGRIILDCIMDLGEAMYPDWKQQMKDTLNEEKAYRRSSGGGDKDWRISYR